MLVLSTSQVTAFESSRYQQDVMGLKQFELLDDLMSLLKLIKIDLKMEFLLMECIRGASFTI